MGFLLNLAKKRRASRNSGEPKYLHLRDRWDNILNPEKTEMGGMLTEPQVQFESDPPSSV